MSTRAFSVEELGREVPDRACLHKPFRQAVLLDAVRTLLNAE